MFDGVGDHLGAGVGGVGGGVGGVGGGVGGVGGVGGGVGGVRGKLLTGCRYFRGDVCIGDWDDGWTVR